MRRPGKVALAKASTDVWNDVQEEFGTRCALASQRNQLRFGVAIGALTLSPVPGARGPRQGR